MCVMESLSGEETRTSTQAFASIRSTEDTVRLRGPGTSFWQFCWELPLWEHEKPVLNAGLPKCDYIRSAMGSGRGRGGGPWVTKLPPFFKQYSSAKSWSSKKMSLEF